MSRSLCYPTLKLKRAAKDVAFLVLSNIETETRCDSNGFWRENGVIQPAAKFLFHHVTKLMYDFERIC